MSLIKIENLTFCYENGYYNIFENVSFNIDTDWKLGFIGRNGRGKTTFLKLLLNEYKYTGNINSSVQFEYFPYEIKNSNKNTINVIEDLGIEFEEWELLKEFNLLEISENVLYRKFNTLSKGEQTKVLLSSLFLKENSFLLIDEPTNHLDVNARKIVSKYLNLKNGFILVSHDRNFLDSCVDHIISINKNNIEIQRNNFTSWWENKQKQDNFELDKNEKLKKDIKRLNKSSKRASGWSDKVEKTKYSNKVGGLKPDRGYVGHKAAKMMKSSKNIEKRKQSAIDEKSKLLKNIDNYDDLKLSPLDYYKNDLVVANNLSIYYSDNVVFDNLNFTIQKGDIIALTGKNGSGKSSILNLISGKDIKYSGDFKISNNIKISYVPQDTSFLSGSFNDFILYNDINENLFKTILRKLGFERVEFENKIEGLSSGQRKKILIAKSLTEKAHLYIWDEPLNFIDVFSRIQIEELITKYKPTMIFVEHDSEFCNKIATKTIKI